MQVVNQGSRRVPLTTSIEGLGLAATITLSNADPVALPYRRWVLYGRLFCFDLLAAVRVIVVTTGIFLYVPQLLLSYGTLRIPSHLLV